MSSSTILELIDAAVDDGLAFSDKRQQLADDIAALTQLTEQEVKLVEQFRTAHADAPRNGFMIVTLPPEAMVGDEQREAIQQAVVAVFAALAAVAR